VVVSDDGQGGVSGAGELTALRDRVGSVGGRLEVSSPPGGGTRVSAVI
jgi:signal transduction histidine kinase